MAKPSTVQAETQIARRFHTRRRARCSARNSLSRGSGNLRKRKPLASRRAASPVLADEDFGCAMNSEPWKGLPASETALYVFGRRCATVARGTPSGLGDLGRAALRRGLHARAPAFLRAPALLARRRRRLERDRGRNSIFVRGGFRCQLEP